MMQKAQAKMLQRMLWVHLTVKEFVVAETTRKYEPPAHLNQGVHHDESTPKQQAQADLRQRINNICNLY